MQGGIHSTLHTRQSSKQSDKYQVLHRCHPHRIRSTKCRIDTVISPNDGHIVAWNMLLTYSMVQSPSWEANWFAASQEIPRISRNPKVPYRTHKRPPPVCILGQPNPVHIPTSHLLNIHPHIIHPSTPRSPQWSPSLRFPHQDPIHPSLLTHTCHMPIPSHSTRFIIRTLLGEEYKSCREKK